MSELDLFEKYTGFVAGTTNQLFLNYPKAKADIVINIDKNQIIQCPVGQKEQFQSIKLRAAKIHTNHEKVFISQITQFVAYLEERRMDQTRQKDIDGGFTDIQTGQETEDNWEITDAIRTHINNYLLKLLFIIARLKRFISEFDTQFAPQHAIKTMT